MGLGLREVRQHIFMIRARYGEGISDANLFELSDLPFWLGLLFLHPKKRWNRLTLRHSSKEEYFEIDDEFYVISVSDSNNVISRLNCGLQNIEQLQSRYLQRA